MCGIIYYNGEKANERIAQQYQMQKSRGSQGFGYVSIDNDKIHKEVRACGDDIFKKIRRDNSPIVLFHHRFPTSTPNFAECAHPIKVSHKTLKYDYYVTHNGIINNDDTLYARHKAMGFKYTTELHEEWKMKTGQRYVGDIQFNDSECLAIELALYLDGKKDTIDTTGSIAFVGIMTTKTGKYIKTFYGRNLGNPLTIKDSKKGIRISSEGGQLLKHNVLYTIEKLGARTETDLKIGNYADSSSGFRYGGYTYDKYGQVTDNNNKLESKITIQGCDIDDDGWNGADYQYMAIESQLETLYDRMESPTYLDLPEAEQKMLQRSIAVLEDKLSSL